ncbi:ubiquitin carboxyl-terminal hydrolase MINDY-3 homolog [Anopheles ziemanni]|uniref:ubiquitin carboxyl-terminal hydrolase MINDY-3 homolog n=1 Tax=Anopheles coustani TaxID=139045 RepID=UPI0026591426|nr:ubiquitin carboxyl-terminal hydrolase MINDY-3 homolog [Anopheles coustani]XP_058175870.1 ubiquitin carboxyl-terminal hydrolase MINDY-3 homolog [Anopheles ziemanni]
MGEHLASQSMVVPPTTGIEQTAGPGSSGMTGDNSAGSSSSGSNSSTSGAGGNRMVSKEFFTLLWGSKIKQDVFRRWLQGFSFSEHEPSALVQRDGGPCCVIAPVQAYLLKILLMETPGHTLGDLTADKCKTLLIQAVCQILTKCKTDAYRIVTLESASAASASSSSSSSSKEHTTSEVAGENQSADAIASNAGLGQDVANAECVGYDVPDAAMVRPAEEAAAASSSSSSGAGGGGGAGRSHDCRLTPEEFHCRIGFREFNSVDDVQQFYMQNFHILTDECGVLLLLYTVLQTKGLEAILSEMSDPSESLIHDTYGCGSQALINLMLTGRAVPHVWDNEQDVGGMKLKGINQQSDIGFITVMEQLQYCTVGFFYKNPKNPVWVMGSDTHLTVLFSNEKRLVSPETPSEVARRVFRQFDADGSNFIPSPMLQDVLCALDLVSEPEYVDLMRSRLDPENLGIILLNAFMNEFFPNEKKSTPDTFDLLHYNGIPHSNLHNRVLYNRGHAVLLESDMRMYNSSDPMLTCLQTKWHNIEVNWNGDRTPSLN